MTFPTSQPAIGQLIRTLRTELQLTQEQFAHSIGVSRYAPIQNYKFRIQK